MSIDFNALDGMGSPLWSGGGQAVQGFTYSPYGGGPARSGGMQLGFNGERLDPINQTYHLGNGYRTYDPTLMRFTAPDSWSPFGAGGLNAYAYCEGDPINRTDPSGHMSWQAGVGMGLGLLSILGAVLSLGMAMPAEGVMVALLSLDAADVLAGGLGLAAGVTSIASDATQDSNPRASEILGWISFGLGITSVSVHAGKMTRGKLKRRPATRLLDDHGMEMRPLTSATTDGASASRASTRRAEPIGAVLAQDVSNTPGPSRSTGIPGRLNTDDFSGNPTPVHVRTLFSSETDMGLVTRNARGTLVSGNDMPIADGRYYYALSNEGNVYLVRPLTLTDEERFDHVWDSVNNVEVVGELTVRNNRIDSLNERSRHHFYYRTEREFRKSARKMLNSGFIDGGTVLEYFGGMGVSAMRPIYL